ncbi:MAG: twin-arginine translocase TatA/TatE family subunit [Chloroflexota bacterium]
MTDTAVVLLIILVLVVIWRGPKTLPEIGRLLGRGVKSARTEVRSMRKGEDDSSDPADR